MGGRPSEGVGVLGRVGDGAVVAVLFVVACGVDGVALVGVDIEVAVGSGPSVAVDVGVGCPADGTSR